MAIPNAVATPIVTIQSFNPPSSATVNSTVSLYALFSYTPSDFPSGVDVAFEVDGSRIPLSCCSGALSWWTNSPSVDIPADWTPGAAGTYSVSAVLTDAANSSVRFFQTVSVQVSQPSYSVTYNGNGNSGGSPPADAGSPYASGTPVTVLGNTGSLTKTDHQFLTWNDAQNGNGSNRSPGTTFNISQNTTLYARWVGGPMEFRTSPNGPAVSTAAFPDTVAGQTSTLTVYMRNVGAAVYMGNQTAGVSISATTCPINGQQLQQYNGTSVTDCTYTLSWTAASNINTQLSVSYSLTNTLALTGNMLQAARTPTFDTPVATSDGFTVNVTNWNNSWSWTPATSSGAVTAGAPSGSSLPVTVTGLGANASATLSVVTSRNGYASGTATVNGVSLAASGGGGGGGGSSTDPAAETPTAGPSAPTVVTPSTPQSLGPNTSTSGVTLPPGGSFATVGGTTVPVATKPNVSAGTSTTSGDGWSVTQGGLTPASKSQPLGGGTVVQLPTGGAVAVSGSGYAPGTTVVVYSMNPALQLGTLTVRSDGTFAGTLPVPGSLKPGNAVIQVNGYAPNMQVRSVSSGVRVVADASRSVRTVQATVFFAAGSSKLTPDTIQRLAKAAASIPKGAKSVRVVSMGYVQGTSDKSNNFTLSTARAKAVAEQLKRDRVRGTYLVSGRGVAQESGVAGRKVIVTITYRL